LTQSCPKPWSGGDISTSFRPMLPEIIGACATEKLIFAMSMHLLGLVDFVNVQDRKVNAFHQGEAHVKVNWLISPHVSAKLFDKCGC